MTTSKPPAPPSGLAQRGRRLWREALCEKPTLGIGERVMLHEACRLADRLDRFDRLLRGEVATWATIRERRGDDGDLELCIDSAASEARQTAGQLRQHITALGLVSKSAEASSSPEVQTDVVDEISARRGVRIAGS